MISPTNGNRLIITPIFAELLISIIEGAINMRQLFAENQRGVKKYKIMNLACLYLHIYASIGLRAVPGLRPSLAITSDNRQAQRSLPIR